jgi:ComF family protein
VPRLLDAARAAGDYGGSLREILHAFKYGRMRSIAGRLADLMRREGDTILSDADAVVPVPLHASRRRTRGFNQAADLAARLGPPLVHALRRVRRTSPQTDLSAAQRRANVRGAFAARRRAHSLVEGRTVVLVDDIWTTGATLEACAATLRQAGAVQVRAITAARVTRPPRP